MANKTLQIIIDAKYKGAAAFKKARDDAKGLGKETSEASRSIKGALVGIGAVAGGVGVALGAVGAAAKVAWQALGEGAQLELARGRFDNLAESINTTGDALLGKLREATSGMMTDAALVASATDMMSLGLAKTEEQAVRMTTVVGKLGWDMQQVVLTMANNSTMRLDALGLSVESVTSRAKELEAAGYSLDEAFDLAVIEAGEAKIELLGDSADTTAGKIKQLETALQNAKDAFSAAFAGELAAEMDGMGEGAAALGENLVYAAEGAGKLAALLAGGMFKSLTFTGQMAQFGELTRQLEEMGGNIDAIRDKFPAMFTPGGRAAPEQAAAAIEEVNRQIAILQAYGGESIVIPVEVEVTTPQGAGPGDFATDMDAWGTNIRQVRRAVDALGDSFDESAPKIKNAADMGQQLAQGLSRIEESAQAAAAAFRDAQLEIATGFTDAIGALQDAEAPDMFSEDGAVNAQMMADAIYAAGSAAGGTAGELANLGIALGEFTPEMAEAALKAAIFQAALVELSKDWKMGELSTEDFIASVQDVADQLQGKTVVQLEYELKEKEDGRVPAPVRVPVEPEWVDGDPVAGGPPPVQVPVEFTAADGALQSALDQAGIPEEGLTEEVVFTANVEAVTVVAIEEITTAATNAEPIIVFDADIAAVTGGGEGGGGAIGTIMATASETVPVIVFDPETQDVDNEFNRLNGTHITVFVDFVPTGAVPASGGGGGADRSIVNKSYNFNANITGVKDTKAVARVVDHSLREFYVDLQREGIYR